MSTAASDNECQKNYNRLRMLFDKIIPDAKRFSIVYAFGVDVGMMSYNVSDQSSFNYASYIIGFDNQTDEVVILPVDKSLANFGKPVHLKSSEVESATQGWLSREITIRDQRLPFGYIPFYVPEDIKTTQSDIVLPIEQRHPHRQFSRFFKKQFVKN